MSTQIRCAGCQRPFTPSRSDALTCSVRCRVAVWRRSRDSTAPAKSDAPPTEHRHANGVTSPEDLHGWRRIGGYLIPPPDECYTITILPDRDP